MTEQIHYRPPKALRMHLERVEKRCRRDAQRDERQCEHADGVRALEAAVVTSAIKAQQR